MVLAAAARGVRSVVICPTLIYGVGKGLNPSSIQIPFRGRAGALPGRSARRRPRPQPLVDRPCRRRPGRPVPAGAGKGAGRLLLFRGERERPPSPRSVRPSPRASAWVPSSCCRQSRWRRRGGPAGRTTPSGSNSRVRARPGASGTGCRAPRHGSALDWIRDADARRTVQRSGRSRGLRASPLQLGGQGQGCRAPPGGESLRQQLGQA